MGTSRSWRRRMQNAMPSVKRDRFSSIPTLSPTPPPSEARIVAQAPHLFAKFFHSPSQPLPATANRGNSCSSIPAQLRLTPSQRVRHSLPTRGLSEPRVLQMRLVLACPWLFLLLTVAVEAETRIFIVDNDDGYGVDRCLATGASCRAAVASAYCRSQAFADARSFRKVAQFDITAGVPAKPTCRRGCSELVAIECTR